jgi:hypothetical protein
MKAPFPFLLVAILAFVALPANAADRACRPSLSNFYHCPDTSPSTTQSPKTDEPTQRKMVSTSRACKPSLSNGYSCPSTSPSANSTSANRPRPAKTTASAPDRGCHPSWSNGYKCPDTSTSSGGPSGSGAYQYPTEGQARARCPTDTVVWLNTRSNIYHFGGTRNYGTTKAGAYMCENDSLREGMRAAKNETHP